MTPEPCPQPGCEGRLRLIGTHWDANRQTTTFHECGICPHYERRTEPRHETPSLFDNPTTPELNP